MQILNGCVVAALLGSFSLSSHAATLVEHKDFQGNSQKAYITATHARMESPRAEQYMLIDLATKKLYAIDGQKRAIIELGMQPAMPQMPPQFQQNRPPAPTVNADLVHKGAGMPVAGFTTQHYQVLANGEVCSNDFLSLDAAQVANMASFIAAMQEITEKRKQGMANMPFMQRPPCVVATEQLQARYKTLGVPMKSMDKDGKVRYEIANIQTGVQVAADAFSLPTGYQMLNEQQMMQSMMQQMQEAMRQQGQQVPPPAQGQGQSQGSFPMPRPPMPPQQQGAQGAYPTPPPSGNYPQPYAPPPPPPADYRSQ